MPRRQAIASIIVLLVSMFFGVNEESLNSIVDWIDPPVAGFARVEEVVDGDTVVVRFGETKERVRLIGVDTPETHHPNKAVQCFGEAASEYLKGLLSNTDVRLEADPTNTNRDRYDRLLRYVYTEDNELVNLKIISEGYGFAYTIFPFQKIDQFRAAQAQASAQSSGLWGECDIVESGDSLNTVPDADAD